MTTTSPQPAECPIEEIVLAAIASRRRLARRTRLALKQYLRRETS